MAVSYASRFLEIKTKSKYKKIYNYASLYCKVQYLQHVTLEEFQIITNKSFLWKLLKKRLLATSQFMLNLFSKYLCTCIILKIIK